VIRYEDLVDAPSFATISEQVKEMLKDSVLVAHNARFDYSFLRHEFKRLDKHISQKQLCTVRLAKSLFPSLPRHNLDAIIQSFAIPCPNRHRAFDDAKVLYHFLEIAQKQVGEVAFTKAVTAVIRQNTIPKHIRGITLKILPESTGVYIFYGENKLPLYIGKSNNIKKRVFDHFRSDINNGIEMRISQQVKKISYIKTSGELGALLLESRMIKQMQPLYNKKLRHKKTLVVLKEKIDPSGYPIISHTREATGQVFSPEIVGMFPSLRQAKAYLLEKAKTYSLCQKLLGLEKTKGACFGYRLETCLGACIQKEDALRYKMRHILAFSQDRVKPWPFASAIAIVEQNEESSEYILVDKWVFLGSITKTEDKEKKYHPYQQDFDQDTYKIITSYLYNKRSTTNIKVLKENELTMLTKESYS
jgi:DNA polymerase-3 subunit epsilon